MAASEFDGASAVERVAEGRWRSALLDGWDVRGVPNGGYSMAVALRAMLEAVSQPDPLAVSAYYLAPASAGPVEIDVEVLRSGGRHATTSGSMRQDGNEVLRLLATFGQLGGEDGARLAVAEPPRLPSPDTCASPRSGPGYEIPAVMRRVDMRLAPEDAGFPFGRRSGTSEVAGWARFTDGRDPDTASLPLFADVFPPAIFNTGLPIGWVPTLAFTVLIRGRPQPGWLRCVFRTRWVAGGYLEEDGEVWDSADQLVAQSRQLALTPRG